MDNSKTLLKIFETDNVAIAIQELQKGQRVDYDGTVYTVGEDIPRGHKMALVNFKKGDTVIKYGNPIGAVTADVPEGGYIHTHNMKTNLSGEIEYTYRPEPKHSVDTRGVRETFMGYRRENGEVGTRNEIWVIPTVSCVNHATSDIARIARERYGDICDGIFALPHNAGCSQLGEDRERSRRILASIINHPNAGGVVLVSLGCEQSNLKDFLPYLGEKNPDRFKVMICQEVEDEIETGVALVGELIKTVSGDKREEVPVSELKIGFKCGGSDSLSGVTANPLCGTITDRITSLGGTSILTEVPEMFGAEHLLMNRARDKETFDKIVKLINEFKEYYIGYGQPIYENPEPGNKAGGITTLEEKSLGCITKGGLAEVVDTLDYGQPASVRGLNLMTGPGNDNVSVTNLLASGAQIICFTTGRGNPLGTAVPCLKIASNIFLYNLKKKWFDFNAGTLVYNDTMETACDDLWNLILDIASGKKQTRSEENGYKEIMIFKDGVVS